MEIYIISFFILLLSMLLFKVAAGNLSITKPHLISIIFYKDFILFAFIGVLLIASSYDLENDLYFWGITSHVSNDARLNGWLSTMYTLCVFPIGMMITNIIFTGKFSAKTKLENFYNSPFSPLVSRQDSSVFISLCVFLIISTFSLLYTFYIIGHIPILSLIKGASSTELAQIRANAKIHFSGITAIRDILAINMTFFLSLVCYGYKLMYKKGKFSYLFYYSFILSFMALTYNLEKAPIFWYFMSLFAIKILFNKGVSFKKIALVILIILMFLFLVYTFLTGTENSGYDFLYRTFVAQSVAIFQGFEYFPERHDFLGVNGISNTYSSLLGGEFINSGRLLFELYSPNSIENNTAGFIVGLFNAEAWMLFGWAGVIFLPLYVGFFVQTLNILLLSINKSPIYIALYIYFWSKLSLSGSVAQFLYPLMVITILVIAYSIIQLSKFFARINQE